MNRRNDLEQIFLKNYSKLNPAQKEAVDQIDGPVLVIAGPGTGKTQLLSIRIAQILRQTDTDAQNILAMTYTEAGARNMRERLSRFIGNEAYKVNIFTYHAFADDILRYNEYFLEKNLGSLADDLATHQILTEIQDNLELDNILKKTPLKSLKDAIANFKKADISPEMLRKIARQNTTLDKELYKKLKKIDFTFFGGNKGSLEQKQDTFRNILYALQETIKGVQPVEPRVQPNLLIIAKKLAQAIESSYIIENRRQATSPLTAWKNNYFNRYFNGVPHSNDYVNNLRILELANYYQKYQEIMYERGFYDYDDMIIEAVKAIEKNPDLQLMLQEKYQYILLDEYQDTNTIQSRLIELLTNNPADNGRPNVLAVGDDDQAIYAFQGADSSNMIDFFNRYRDTKIVNLTQNYRSHGEILETAKNIAEQIDDRLTDNPLINISKDIIASGTFNSEPKIERVNFKSEPAEYSWVAEKINDLVKSGIKPSEIVVLAPKHKYLEQFSAFLRHFNLPISYEKKENILENPTILALIKIAELAISIRDKSPNMDELFPEVLSFDFWNIPATEVWKISWQARDKKNYWIEEMINNTNQNIQDMAKFLICISEKSRSKSLEEMIDIILGIEPIEIENQTKLYSPIKKYIAENDEYFYDTILHLTSLREKLRDFSGERHNSIDDLVNFSHAYKDAGIKIINTNPHKTNDNAVQLMTPFQAKGLEFEYVFLLSVQNSIWNNKHGGNTALTMPANLDFVNIKDGGENTKKRLLFVAATRAKSHLYLTNYLQDFNGKNRSALSFLDENDGSGELKANVLPEKFSVIKDLSSRELDLNDAQINWHEFYRIKDGDSTNKNTEKMKDLLRPRLENYEISPTHLKSFIDLVYSGPEIFFEKTILGFPSSYSVDAVTGTLVHRLLNLAQDLTNLGKNFTTKTLLNDVSNYINKLGLTDIEKDQVTQKATKILDNFLKHNPEYFNAGDKAETRFKNAGIMVGSARISGTIDLIKINHETKSITVVDYKTGKIPIGKNDKFDPNDLKIYLYTHQLYFYKLLIESLIKNSPEFAGYKVEKGVLEFIEPTISLEYYSYSVDFDKKQEEDLKDLIQAVFERIKNFNFTIDRAKFKSDKKGIIAFEKELIEEFRNRQQ